MMRVSARLLQFGVNRLASARTCTTKAPKLLPPCPPSYDDLPEPIGDWESHHRAKDMKYNIQLGASVLFLVGTIALAKTCGFFQLNYYPPEKPGVRQC